MTHRVLYGLLIKNDGTTLDGATIRGVGSMVNYKVRSYSNARFSINKAKTEATIVSTRPIRNQQEITVPYGRDYRFNQAGLFSSTNHSKYKV